MTRSNKTRFLLEFWNHLIYLVINSSTVGSLISFPHQNFIATLIAAVYLKYPFPTYSIEEEENQSNLLSLKSAFEYFASALRRL